MLNLFYTMKKYNIFLILLIILFVVGNGIYFYFQYNKNFSEEHLKEHPLFQESKEKTVKFIEEKSKELIPEGSFEKGVTSEINLVFENFFNNVQSNTMFRIKVWDKNFTVIWSNLGEIIGQRFVDNHEVEEALGGEVEVEIKKAKGEHVTETPYANFKETYVPIKNNAGIIVGAIEVYESTEDIIAKIKSEFLRQAFFFIGISVIIFIVVALVGKIVIK